MREDNFTNEISLTLNPTAEAAVAQAVAETEASVESALAVQGPAPALAVQPVSTAVSMDYALSPAETKMVDEFSKKIDIADSNMVMQYGAAAQKNISNFSENALNSVKSKDLGEVGEALGSLVVELKGFDVEEKKGLFGFFQKKRLDLEALKANYDSASANIDKIVEQLNGHQIALMKDIALLDNLYDLNEKYCRELTMYIVAGKKALERERSTTLEELRLLAAQTGRPEDAQAYNDFANLCTRFEKKLHDLELTRVISIQMAPQTRMIQNNDALILEKIQSSISNTIPLWKSQIVMALGIENSRKATAAVTAVSDVTNELLKRNADALKMGTIEVAKEAERSIVSIESIKHANEQLISSIDEVMTIQQEGAQQRKQAEAELAQIEGQLKQKLLELRG